MLSNTYEPKLQHRWLLVIDGLDSFLMESVTKPQLQHDEVVIPYINNVRFVAGRQTPQPMNVVIKEAVYPSATQKVMNWLRLQYEPETGRAGYHAMYAKDIILKGLDGPGAVIEKWVLKNAWLQSPNFGELTYESGNTQVRITATIRYDRALLEY